VFVAVVVERRRANIVVAVENKNGAAVENKTEATVAAEGEMVIVV